MYEILEPRLTDHLLEDSRGHLAASEPYATGPDGDCMADGSFGCDKKELLRIRSAARSETMAARFLRLLRDSSGVTMVEFALVGPLFLLLSFMVIETGLVLFTQSVLDNAARDAARQIRIGQVQMTNDTDGTGLFKTTLCTDLGAFIPCASLKWHVQSSAAGFAALDATVTTDGSGNMTSTGFTPGTMKAFVIVQVGYKRSYIVPWLGTIAGATGTALLVSTVAFQTENYQ